MATTSYFEEPLYPVGGNGLADESAEPVIVEVNVSSYYGNHQVYMMLQRDGIRTILHLTKKQAKELGDALLTAQSSIGYDNRRPFDPTAPDE